MPTTKSTENLLSEPLDIRQVTPYNLDELVTLTGYDRRYLERELATADSHGRELHLMVNNPLITPRRKRNRQTKCVYDHKWSEQTGWSQLCAVHKKPTWHNLFDDPDAPCIEIDPKPDDA